MKGISDIIGEELRHFESHFSDAVKSRTSQLDMVMRYIIKRKGKQIRPMFVFLSAKLHGPVNESTYRAAALVEMLHTATLVHDDVVDESMERRGFFSVNALWKNKIAVLVGDYLLSKGLLLAVNNDEFEQLRILSDAIRKMSEGELLQIQKTRKLNITEDIYFEIIRNKTASLLASACGVGAYSTTKDKAICENMQLFGEKTGIAFQIKDDLFDYGSDNVGKPTGNDIKEKKMTLPLIYTLNNTDRATMKKIIYIVKNNNRDKQKVKWVIDAVEEAGGIKYAQQKMLQYRDEALNILKMYPASPVNNALAELVRYTTDRKF